MPLHSSPIYVDTRETTRPSPRNDGTQSGVDMLALIRSHRDSPVALPKRLTAGDFCFAGEGPKSLPCLVGIERKRIKGLLSDIRTSRLSGEQLPKLFDHYEFVFLVIEGKWRTNWRSGVLEEPRRDGWGPLKVGEQTFLGLELDSYLTTISVHAPVRIICTLDERETVDKVVGLNHSFSKPWDKHHAHIGIHRPDEYATVGKASTVRRVAYCLSGLGWERSGAVDQHFRSVSDMCTAGPKEWQKLDGFGKVLSERVYRELHGQYEPGGLE